MLDDGNRDADLVVLYDIPSTEYITLSENSEGKYSVAGMIMDMLNRH